jgi:hypothetical protein
MEEKKEDDVEKRVERIILAIDPPKKQVDKSKDFR